MRHKVLEVPCRVLGSGDIPHMTAQGPLLCGLVGRGGAYPLSLDLNFLSYKMGCPPRGLPAP